MFSDRTEAKLNVFVSQTLGKFLKLEVCLCYQNTGRDKGDSHTTPVTLHPYPSRFILPHFPIHVSGILSQTVLQSPLISSIHYIRTVLSITAQNPSVKEQIIDITHEAILCLHKKRECSSQHQVLGRNPQQETADEVFSL